MLCSLVTGKIKEHGHGRAFSPWISFFASYYSVDVLIVFETCMIFTCTHIWLLSFFVHPPTIWFMVGRHRLCAGIRVDSGVRVSDCMASPTRVIWKLL